MQERYFIAIVPENPLFDLIEGLKLEANKICGTKASLRSPSHLTLHMPFLFNSSKEEFLTSSIAESISTISRFNISTHKMGFFGERVIFLDVIQNEELRVCQKKIVEVMKKCQIFNQADSLMPFHPHFTVAFRDITKKQFSVLWSFFSDKQFDFTFTVSKIELLRFSEEEKKWRIINSIPIHESR